MDFSISTYLHLLDSLKKSDYSFQTFSGFLLHPGVKSIILRHDVDLLPQNSLRFARIQHNLGINGSYYFRGVPESWDEKIIIEISKLGHEIGYHYESLTTCKGDMAAAIKDFETNLEELRKLAPVSTICMHGSPRSPFDSKDLWKHYDYRDYGIVGEPYFDTNFSQVLYLTDTGRRWDGDKFSVRDKVSSSNFERFSFKNTSDIIEAVEQSNFPSKIMFTFHPQRWTNKPISWVKELVWQNIKNMVKRRLYVKH